MSVYLQVGYDGRLLIPKRMREELGIRDGGKVLVDIVDHNIKIATVESSIKLAHALVKQYCKSDIKIVDEFLQTRKQEAISEESKFNKIKKG